MFRAKFILLTAFVTFITAEYKIEPRIVQGRDATRGQFPFYAFLQIYVPDGISLCGGSLISDEWVLTAAHCLRNAMRAIVHLGSLKATEWNQRGQRFFPVTSENMHIYPKYSQLFFLWNDIGLIRLPMPVTFSDVIQPIPFSCSPSSDSEEDVIAIGNGMQRDNDPNPPSVLQYTELRTISNLSCLKTYPFLLFRKSIFCVQGEEQRSICDGDSGGPLITSNNYLLGLTSFGRRSCQYGSPQVFTRISQYADWIEEKTGVKCKNNNWNKENEMNMGLDSIV